jgi:hypothetical protein
MRCDTWNVRILYRAGSLTEVARELARYKLGLVGVQEVRWKKGVTVRAMYYNFSMEKETKSLVGNSFFLYNTEQYRKLID